MNADISQQERIFAAANQFYEAASNAPAARMDALSTDCVKLQSQNTRGQIIIPGTKKMA